MVNKKEAKNCWEYWSCVKTIREKCAVFMNNYGQSVGFCRVVLLMQSK
ncbi:MAG: hypothetical protein KJ710_02160 [Candidatus Omnitrophica bacterium]|nr:hypothetical protein [Candidatus Omnitrophota bacterium]MBU1923053.1 hypothetical protein [Candidatus Omnitrophota bacterium]